MVLVALRANPTGHSLRFPCRVQVLDFGLNHRNSAVVMATAKLFLHYTLAFPAQHQQVSAQRL